MTDALLMVPCIRLCAVAGQCRVLVAGTSLPLLVQFCMHQVYCYQAIVFSTTVSCYQASVTCSTSVPTMPVLHAPQTPVLRQVRDIVESSLKPGDTTLVLLGALTPLIRRLGPNADPANLKRLPLAAAAVWALFIGEGEKQTTYTHKHMQLVCSCEFVTAFMDT